MRPLRRVQRLASAEPVGPSFCSVKYMIPQSIACSCPAPVDWTTAFQQSGGFLCHTEFHVFIQCGRLSHSKKVRSTSQTAKVEHIPLYGIRETRSADLRPTPDERVVSGTAAGRTSDSLRSIIPFGLKFPSPVPDHLTHRQSNFRAGIPVSRQHLRRRQVGLSGPRDGYSGIIRPVGPGVARNHRSRIECRH